MPRKNIAPDLDITFDPDTLIVAVVDAHSQPVFPPVHFSSIASVRADPLGSRVIFSIERTGEELVVATNGEPARLVCREISLFLQHQAEKPGLIG